MPRTPFKNALAFSRSETPTPPARRYGSVMGVVDAAPPESLSSVVPFLESLEQADAQTDREARTAIDARAGVFTRTVWGDSVGAVTRLCGQRRTPGAYVSAEWRVGLESYRGAIKVVGRYRARWLCTRVAESSRGAFAPSPRYELPCIAREEPPLEGCERSRAPPRNSRREPNSPPR